jgi:hypothetical protein
MEIKLNETISDELISIVRLLMKNILKKEESNYEINCEYRIHALLKNSSKYFNLKNRTVLYGLILLFRLHENNPGLKEMRNHIDLMFIFISCLIIGYKMEHINHFENHHWCNELVGYLDYRTVNECEIFVIKHLNFNLYIEEKDIHEMKIRITNNI